MHVPHPGETFRVTAGERPAVLAHLLMLDADDRYGRFATSLPDSAIEAYVSRIDCARDICIGIAGTGGQLAGFIHLAVHREVAELAASVCAQWRRQGIARQLFLAAVRLALLRGIREIHLATGHPAARRIFAGMGYCCKLRATYPRGIIGINTQPARDRFTGIGSP